MMRAVCFTLFGFLSLILLGPLQLFLGMEMAAIDVPLTIIVYLAVVDHRGGRRTAIYRHGWGPQDVDWSVATTVLFLGYLTDLLGGGTKGLHSFSFSVVYILSRIATKNFYVVTMSSQCMVTFLASFIASTLTLGLRLVADIGPCSGMWGIIVIQAFFTAAVAPLVMKALRFVDFRLSGVIVDKGSF